MERIIRVMEKLGLRRVDAELYIYLAKRGPISLKEIVEHLQKNNLLVFDSLKRLIEQGYVHSQIENQTVFLALEFEQILERAISKKDSEAQTLKQSVNELLDSWSLITLN